MSDAPTKAEDAYRTISEVADQLDLPQHVLRFWESKFPQIKPLKRSGNRRYYRPGDVATITAIKQLLHDEGYTIRGVQKLFKEQGLRLTVNQVLAGGPVGTAATVTEQPAPVDQGLSKADRNALRDTLATLKALRQRLD